MLYKHDENWQVALRYLREVIKWQPSIPVVVSDHVEVVVAASSRHGVEAVRGQVQRLEVRRLELQKKTKKKPIR